MLIINYLIVSSGGSIGAAWTTPSPPTDQIFVDVLEVFLKKSQKIQLALHHS